MRTRYLVAWLAGAALILMLLPGAPARAEPSVAEPFRAYYDQHQGMRVLGYPLTGLVEAGGYAAQYFEKGRIEDHQADPVPAAWAFMYGRLTAELIERGELGSTTSTSVTYADLRHYHDPAYRNSVPSGFRGGTTPVHDGMFVPYDPQLRAAPGYIVAPYFWAYINRTELFPGGWLHDIGLPMTDPLTSVAVKNGERHTIWMQAFERTVLTYDPRNPAGWQVERGNIGADALGVTPVAGPITIPAAGAQVTLPLHILAHVGKPGEQVSAALRWQDGTTIAYTFTTLRDTDGSGLLIDSLDWTTGADLLPASQPALLELRDSTGAPLAQQWVRVLNYADPDVQEITLYWVQGENAWPALRHIPKTVRIGTAALNELLWGPEPRNQARFTTALPTPQQVLSYPGREPDWGPRVTLRSLTIKNGLATADFSQELRAYGGGSLRVMLIREQIAHTLKQFPTVRDVRIAVEGQTEAVLEP